jgi:hypothetical protein
MPDRQRPTLMGSPLAGQELWRERGRIVKDAGPILDRGFQFAAFVLPLPCRDQDINRRRVDRLPPEHPNRAPRPAVGDRARRRGRHMF